MPSHFRRILATVLFVNAFVLAYGSVAVVLAAEGPSIPAVSSFAPLDGLTAELKDQVSEIEKQLAAEEYGEDQKNDVGMYSHGVVALAQAIGLSDEKSDMQAGASQIMALAKDLASKAGSKEDAAKVLANLKGAIDSPVAGDSPKWEKAAGLGRIMHLAMVQQGKVEQSFKRFDRRGKNAVGPAVTLAVIANAASFDTHEVKDPAQLGEWYAFAGQMRDAAVAVRKAAEGTDAAAASEAAKLLEKSCADCHNVFHKEE